MSLAGRKVLVVGLGKSGVAAARLLAREGARVTVNDRRGAEDLGPALAALDGLPVDRRLGGHDRADFAAADLVVVSPGVPALPELSAAREVIGEIELAARFVDAPLVGITGTNGKSTTTALTGALLSAAGRAVFVGGNLGTPLSELALSRTRVDAVVCELSSFQLETARSLHCRAAAVLNLTPDHLDRYPDMAAYGAAKRRIFQNQIPGDAAILNADDPAVSAMGAELPARALTFGRNAPPAPGGVRDAGGTLVHAPLSGGEERYTVANRTLRGAHNRENAMAAVLCARWLGASPADVQKGLDAYPGLPHRLEPVRTLDGVEYVNDSKATNVDSVAKSLTAFERGVWLIAGGRGKGAPYAPLRPLIAGRVRGLLLIGEDAERIGRELGDLVPAIYCGEMGRAVREGHALAAPGETVLLSPACASYDQFQNFGHRGETFARMVSEL